MKDVGGSSAEARFGALLRTCIHGITAGTTDATSHDDEVSRFFHVTSSLNRDSIRSHGLDWTRMGAARGIAGSTEPEQQGCFVCLDEFELDWFLGFHDRGTVDVWAVDGFSEDQLVESPQGHSYIPTRVELTHLELVRRDVPARR